MRLRHPEVKTQHLVDLYAEKHLTLRQIAKLVGISPQAIRKRLLDVGVTAWQGEHVERVCLFCGRRFTVTRCQVRQGAGRYCSLTCYAAKRENPAFVQWRRGGQLARAIVSQHFRLEDGYVVHHKDGNQRNNDLANLAVFASQGDHSSYHHGKAISPLWDGAGV